MSNGVIKYNFTNFNKDYKLESLDEKSIII